MPNLPRLSRPRATSAFVATLTQVTPLFALLLTTGLLLVALLQLTVNRSLESIQIVANQPQVLVGIDSIKVRGEMLKVSYTARNMGNGPAVNVVVAPVLASSVGHLVIGEGIVIPLTASMNLPRDSSFRRWNEDPKFINMTASQIMAGDTVFLHFRTLYQDIAQNKYITSQEFAFTVTSRASENFVYQYFQVPHVSVERYRTWPPWVNLR
jgi:hypothetical protein